MIKEAKDQLEMTRYKSNNYKKDLIIRQQEQEAQNKQKIEDLKQQQKLDLERMKLKSETDEMNIKGQIWYEKQQIDLDAVQQKNEKQSKIAELELKAQNDERMR